jgi:hypothetical protein
MEAPAPDAIPYQETMALIGLPKTIIGDVAWQQSPTESELFTADFNFWDEAGATIPGLTLRLMYRRGIIKGECKSTFTIFKFVPPKLRAYQLEVIPDEKIGHREAGVPWKGPHKHIGDKAVQVHPMGYRCDDHEQWFRYFLTDAEIKHNGNWKPPQPPDAQFSLEIE